MDILLRFIVAIFLGLIVGIDRDDSWQDKKLYLPARFSFIKPGRAAIGLGGVRTFTFISILGFLAGIGFSLSPTLAFIGVLAFLALIILIAISYIFNFFDKNTLGLTTELSIFSLFTLSFLLGSGLLDTKIILAISVIISLILSLKFELRKAISSFTKREIIESLEFILITGVIYPWLPDVDITLKTFFKYIDYSNPTFENIVLFNPHGLWTVIIFVTSLSFIGYFLVKLFKNNKSLLATGLFGGLVSSTTVTVFMAQKSREATSEKAMDLLVATALIANAASFIQIPFLTLLLNKDLFAITFPNMAVMMGIGLVISYFSIRNNDDQKTVQESIIFQSPLALRSALVFAGIFTGVQVLTQIGLILFGNAGFAVSTLIASASGLPAVTINTSKAVPQTISVEFGALVLLAANTANLIFKLITTFFVGHPYFNKRLALLFTAIIVAGMVGLVVTLFFL